MVAVLAAWTVPALDRAEAGGSRRSRPTARALARLGGLGLRADRGGGPALAARARRRHAALAAGRDGVLVPERDAANVEAAVRAIRARVPPGEPIYVVPARSDLVTPGNPLLYVLADRPNPTRYDIQAPGVVTSAPVQREIIADLERTARASSCATPRRPRPRRSPTPRAAPPASRCSTTTWHARTGGRAPRSARGARAALARDAGISAPDGTPCATYSS
jgi:hypothetical protein